MYEVHVLLVICLGRITNVKITCIAPLNGYWKMHVIDLTFSHKLNAKRNWFFNPLKILAILIKMTKHAFVNTCLHLSTIVLDRTDDNNTYIFTEWLIYIWYPTAKPRFITPLPRRHEYWISHTTANVWNLHTAKAQIRTFYQCKIWKLLGICRWW